MTDLLEWHDSEYELEEQSDDGIEGVLTDPCPLGQFGGDHIIKHIAPQLTP